jgi:hypothetical protein
MVRTPNDVFAFMNANKIGDKVALYWIAWAFVAEKNDNFKLADQIFQKGIRHFAEPKDILQKRYQQFQRRLARHYINLSEANGGVLPITDSASTNTRAPLALVTDENSVGNHLRGLHEHNNRSTQIDIQPMSSQRPNIPATAASRPSQNRTFQVFQDNDIAAAPVELLPSNPSWKILGSDTDRRRENEG